MYQSEIEEFAESLDNVQRTENFGYTFFFVGDDHLIPFVSIADTDSDFDKVSNLDREGGFRANIGVSKATFQTLLRPFSSEAVDYTAINVFLPHPDYSPQHFVCILSPSGENVAKTKSLIAEAHSIATTRLTRKQTTRE